MRRGRHKIFIGMAPGVGKTYKMLEEGHSLRKQGTDVVIGLLETHGRKETAAKAEGLEIVPRKILEKEGFTLSEMDTEAIIARSPQLCLIDELAHTNAPGSEREKRFQDVEIILSRGIDVYSTVNIQHIESLNDLVARITGVVMLLCMCDNTIVRPAVQKQARPQGTKTICPLLLGLVSSPGLSRRGRWSLSCPWL